MKTIVIKVQDAELVAQCYCDGKTNELTEKTVKRVFDALKGAAELIKSDSPKKSNVSDVRFDKPLEGSGN